jgi:glutamine cyclotransferase
MIQVTKMKKIFFAALLICLIGCKNDDNNDKGKTTNPPPPPETFNCVLQNTYPHDTSSFTEGLVFYNGSLYESTGDPDYTGKSRLLKIDLKSGQAEKQVVLDKNYFGEGIAILRDTIYQLTYKEHKVFVYTLKDFKKINEFHFDPPEGWGMTTDGTNLIVSIGTSDLYFYEPSDFKQVKKITVTDAGTPGYNVNELEYIDGFIYANQWQLPYILKIDPANGQVVAKADLTDLWNRIKQKDPHAEVLNGIAYDPASKKIYITGKWWPELYQVQFTK